jgi:hypothetical protein
MRSVQWMKGDIHHPNPEFATIIANYIYANSLAMSETPGGDRQITIQCSRAKSPSADF